MAKVDNWVSYEEKYSEWFKKMMKLKELKDKGYPVYIYPSPPDERDFQFKDIMLSCMPLKKDFPSKISLHLSPLVLNQEDAPFCAGASLAGIYNSYYDYYDNMPPEGFSMAFAYWMAKEYDNLNEEGTYLRTILKIGQHYGLCRESLLPLKNAKIKPVITQEMLDDAAKYKIKRYALLNSLEEIKRALANGFYILIGTIVTSDNWDNPPDGFLGLPYGYIKGGHGTFGWGYDDFLKGWDRFVKTYWEGYIKAQNSWGKEWGDEGKFYIPYEYYFWKSLDLGMNAFLEAWLVEFEFQGINKPPQPQPVEPNPEPNPEPEPIKPTPPDCKYIEYIVQKGDTLYGIAQKFGVTLQELIESNPHIVDPSKIYPGNLLYIPVKDENEDENEDEKEEDGGSEDENGGGKRNIFKIILNFLINLFKKLFK